MEQFNGDNIEAGHPNLIRLGVLINGIKNSKIALPEFQRSQVWSANEKKELVISMCLKIPIGSFLLWEFEDDVDVHKDTELRAFPKQNLDKRSVDFLLIDGQQRLSFLSELEDSEFAEQHYVRFIQTKNHDSKKSVRRIIKYQNGSEVN